MTDFMLRFLISNLGIALAFAVLLLIRHVLAHLLTSRTQYNLWYLFLALLSVPFLPFRTADAFQLFKRVSCLWTPDSTAYVSQSSAVSFPVPGKIYDFAVSVSPLGSFWILRITSAVWIAGMAVMAAHALFSLYSIHRMQSQALPLNDKKLLRLYQSCLQELGISRDIPIFTTASVSSPIITGLFRPCIFLPLSTVSSYKPEGMRYMLLHELQHYRHKDAIGNTLAQLAQIVYWFNPVIWNALHRMRGDRELACDSAVQDMLSPEEYTAYGHTLLTLAAKNNRRTMAFGSGISQNMASMKQRILQIADYHRPSRAGKRKSAIIFLATALLLGSLTPALSTYAGNDLPYRFSVPSDKVTEIDLSTYIQSNAGCFVLYDLQKDTWIIHDQEQATRRVSPDSTFKIYDALFALEENIITPQNSGLSWDHQIYPFAQWNQDQDLTSAMQASVNWYFHELNAQMGDSVLRNYIQEIGYGNQDLSAGLSSFWLESSLKISAIEQVKLLLRLYQNDFDFSAENMQAVRDALCLYSSPDAALYGKTGTGRVNGKDVNGWFVGWVGSGKDVYFFAVNLQDEQGATGSKAYEVAINVLEEMNILDSVS